MSNTTVSISQIMETLFRRRAKGLPPHALGALFDRMIWCLDDNGSEIEATREHWLEAEDKEKVEIALAMIETLPFTTRHALIRATEQIMVKWPDLTAQCEALVHAWDEIHGESR